MEASIRDAAPDMTFTDSRPYDVVLTGCQGPGTLKGPTVAISPDGRRVELNDMSITPGEIVALIRKAYTSGETLWTH